MVGSELVAMKNSGVSSPKQSPPSVSTMIPLSGLALVTSMACRQYCTQTQYQLTGMSLSAKCACVTADL